MNEIWKDVVGLEEYAQVSNKGRVKTKERYVQRGKGTALLSPRIINGADNGTGYIQYRLYIDGKVYRKYGHVMVAEAFIPNPDKLPEVNHKDHNKHNNHCDNLEWCTRSQNLYKYYESINGLYEQKYCECGEPIHAHSVSCVECFGIIRRKTERPTKEELWELIKHETFTKIGNIYGVSDNTIRKWCKQYKLPYRKVDIKQLMDL